MIDQDPPRRQALVEEFTFMRPEQKKGAALLLTGLCITAASGVIGLITTFQSDNESI